MQMPDSAHCTSVCRIKKNGSQLTDAVPLLCIASLALAAGIVVFAAWRRMERRKTRREAKRDLSALKRSTLYVRA